MRLWGAFSDASILLLFGGLPIAAGAPLAAGRARSPLAPGARDLVRRHRDRARGPHPRRVGRMGYGPKARLRVHPPTRPDRTPRARIRARQPPWPARRRLGPDPGRRVLGSRRRTPRARRLEVVAPRCARFFYLTLLHTAYFLFIHFASSFHRVPPPENWFRWPLLGLGAGVLFLQWAAFATTVRRRRRPSSDVKCDGRLAK